MKTKTVFSCQNCGYQSPKWLGKCPDCGNWNTFAEEDYAEPVAGQGSARKNIVFAAAREPVLLKEVSGKLDNRFKTGISEMDRVLGGGIVEGSVVLIGGDPGIGKSTISLQISSTLAASGKTVLYVSAEESVEQTKLRAARLGESVNSGNLYIVNQTDLSLVLGYIKKLKPQVVIIDSIQVIFDPATGSAAGSVTQVRECAGILTQLAKATGIAIFIIGHVTKDGALAGPRVLEHVVDTVLYFEGGRFSTHRILRAVKNRFGSTNEIGVFQMGPAGLAEVLNPSEIFLSERPKDTAGTVVVPVLEGSRPLLVEIQALVTKTNFGYASRRAEGFDYNRLNLLIAVLEKRIGLHLGAEDVFVNVAGGIEIEDPAADLAVALAVAGAFRGQIVPTDSVAMGEVGLAGEIRSVAHAPLRIKEAEKLGFKRCVLPRNNKDSSAGGKNKIEIIPVSTLKEALDILLKAK